MRKYLLPLIIILCLVFSNISYPADLFSDDFESGDLSAWDASTTDEGDLSAHADAKIHGSYGMKCIIDDQTAISVRDDTPAAETRYRARFYLDPNGLTMGDGDNFQILRGLITGGGTSNFFIRLYYTIADGYRIRAIDYTDGSYGKSTGYYDITDAPHCIEFDWAAATGAGTNDGWFSLWIDGSLKETVEDIDNDTEEFSYVRFGAPSELDVGTSGTFFLDDFASNDDGTEIGAYSWGYTWNDDVMSAWNDEFLSEW